MAKKECDFCKSKDNITGYLTDGEETYGACDECVKKIPKWAYALEKAYGQKR